MDDICVITSPWFGARLVKGSNFIAKRIHCWLRGSRGASHAGQKWNQQTKDVILARGLHAFLRILRKQHSPFILQMCPDIFSFSHSPASPSKGSLPFPSASRLWDDMARSTFKPGFATSVFWAKIYISIQQCGQALFANLYSLDGIYIYIYIYGLSHHSHGQTI